jgi:hypothetical protein
MIGNPELTTKDVLRILETSGLTLHEWGKAEDGSPMYAAHTGGTKQPAIFITAGAHSTETAGVHAAMNLLGRLETDHEVHILPLRDPMGFAGVQHCLQIAAGEPVQVRNHHAVLEFLQANADLLWMERNLYIFKLGELGFAWCPYQQGMDGYWLMENGIGELSRLNPDNVQRLFGKSVMLIDPNPDFEGAASMQRCWHAFFTREGAWRHLNRMFGDAGAPAEVAAVDSLMQAVKPGLTCDLHEGNGNGFWLPIPKPEKNSERSFLMAKAYFEYINRCGYPVTDYEDWLASDRTPQTALDPNWMFPEERLPGLFWVDTLRRSEGHNLMSYAALFGVGFGTEGPMSRPLSMRIDGITNGILAAIRVWEQTQEINFKAGKDLG